MTFVSLMKTKKRLDIEIFVEIYIGESSAKFAGSAEDVVYFSVTFYKFK